MISKPRKQHHYIILPKKDLRKKLGRGSSLKHFYLTLLSDGRCFNTRGLSKGRLMKAVYDGDIESSRDWTEYVEEWNGILLRR